MSRATRTLVLGTAGHVDHGKSALVEALTGTHPDRLKEEQARGITIALGFAHARLGGLSVAFVDVPGHERFVRTMLAGAGGLDAVLLVVAATESVMPQTREHFDICRLLGIDRGLIVLSKRDLVDDETLALAELEVRELVAGTPLAGAPVVPVSAHTGEGLDALRGAIAALGDSAPARRRGGAARVPIDRAFSVKGFGTVVTGTLVSGACAVDDTLTLLPSGRAARIRGVQVHGETVTMAEAPRRVAVNLGGVDLEDVRRGMTLAAPESLAVVRRADVRLDLLPGSPALAHGARVRVHQGTAEASARVLLSAVRAQSATAWAPIPPGAADAAIPPGGQALARLRLEAPFVLTRGDRLIVRLPSPARTIGGGVVLDPEPARGGVRRAGAAARLAQLDAGGLAEVVAIWIEEAGLAGLTAGAIARRSGVALAEVDAALRDPALAPRLVTSGAVVISADRLARAATDLVALLTAFHRAHPDEAGMPLEHARARVARGAALSTFDAIVARTTPGALVTGDRIALATHRPAVTGEDTRIREALVRALRDAGLQPPDTQTLATAAGAIVTDVQRLLQALGRERLVVRLGDLWFHPDVLAELKDGVRAMGPGATFDVAAAKAAFGVSRKFAIPLLEYLDRERVTRRIGSGRVVI